MNERLRIGGHTVAMVQAESHVRTYFNGTANRTAKKPYAYPAYDELSTGSGPNELNDGDLLASTLLNAAPSIAGFFWLQSIRLTLQDALATIPEDLTLQAAVAAGCHVELLESLMKVLDWEGRQGVRMTTLTKVLHRKRPLFVPLYDKSVRAIYVGDNRYAMQYRRRSTNVDFFVALAQCIVEDLNAQLSVWRQLATIAPAHVSPLRVLDVVTWMVAKEEGLLT